LRTGAAVAGPMMRFVSPIFIRYRNGVRPRDEP
jgi:hypothetical protein